ncbi:hypothetical protein D3C71_825630 [compost metagenome]
MVSTVMIGVTGTHSTGKSTFCSDLRQLLEQQDIRVASIPSFGKLAQEQGIPLLTNHTYDSTMWFIDRTLEAQQAAIVDADVVLVDRPIIDAVAYWNAAVEYRGTSATTQEIDAVHAVMHDHCPTYTMLVATRLDISVPLGPDRDANPAFRQSVDSHLHKLLAGLELRHHMLFPQVRDSLLANMHSEILRHMGRS